MSKNLLLRIVLPSMTFLEQEVEMVNIFGGDGIFGVLPGHSKLISTVSTGITSLFINGREDKYYIHGGIAQVTGEEVNIVTEYAASISESSKEQVENDISDLKKNLENEEAGSVEVEIILDKIEKHKSLMKFL